MFDNLPDTELGRLVKSCLGERNNSGKRETDNGRCFQLIRFAATRDDVEAWLWICEIYRKQVANWVEEHKIKINASGDTDSLIDCTFDNTWQQFRKPSKFTNFPNIRTVMGYIKACARTCVRESGRPLDPIAGKNNEPDIGAQVEKQELRRLIYERLDTLWQTNEPQKQELYNKERIIFQEYFEWGIPPRGIYKRHQELFDSTQEVSRVKRNMLDRLYRDPIIQRLWKDFLA